MLNIDTRTISLYGTVGIIFDEDSGFTAAQVRGWLDQLGPGDVTVNINSGGGFAAEALAIYNMLVAHPGRITVVIEGIAASSASLVAMAGADRIMRTGAMMMIHDPSAAVAGTSQELRKTAGNLELMAAQFVKIYAARSGQPPERIVELMAAETWMDAETALELGFATGMDEQPAAQIAAFDYHLYRNAPRAIAGKTKGTKMENIIDDVVSPPKPWASRFFKAAETSRLPIEALNEIVEASASYDMAKDALIDAMAAGNVNKPTSPNRAASFPGSGQTFDNPDFLATAIEGALYARMTGRPAEGPAREFAGRTLLDMGAALIQARGEKVSWFSRERLASRIMMEGGGQHTTSDFPVLLTQSGNRVLNDAYNAAACPLKLLARRRSAADFRTLTSVRLGEAPALTEVVEGGEVTYGTRAEAAESFKVKTFAKIFSLSRQAFMNDDLGAFADANAAWGRGAAETEATQIVSLMIANTGDGADLDDGTPLYATSRDNKAGTGAAINVTTLGAGRQALRDMKGLDGVTPISVTPRHLVVGSAKETEAEQALTAIMATQINDANPFANKISLHVEPRLSGNAWRLFADPTELAVLAIAYLNGVQGPILETRQGWTTLGIEFRAILDFGCGLTDWRGTYLNPGD